MAEGEPDVSTTFFFFFFFGLLLKFGLLGELLGDSKLIAQMKLSYPAHIGQVDDQM